MKNNLRIINYLNIHMWGITNYSILKYYKSKTILIIVIIMVKKKLFYNTENEQIEL